MFFKQARAKQMTLITPAEAEQIFAKEAAKELRRVPLDPDRSFYMDIWAVSADEKWGPNDNADGFERKELLASYPTFVDSWACLDHENQHESLAVGRNIDAVYTPEDYVRIVMGVERAKAERRRPGLEDKIARKLITDTSMGATLPGTLVTMADGTQKPIEEIKVGDVVLTHMGTLEPVVKIHRGRLKTKIYRVRAAGIQQSVPLTEEHPVWIMRKHMVRSNLGIGEFVKVSELQLGDFISTPVFRGQRVGVNRNLAFVKLLGWFLADGNRTGGKRNDGVVLTLGNHEESRIPYALELFKAIGKMPTYRQRSDKNGWEVCCFDRVLCKEFTNLVGHGAREKRLVDEIMEWPVELQRDFIGHMIDGDGCFDGELHISTSSEHLAHQLKQMLMRLDVSAVVSRNIRLPGSSGKTSRERVEFQLDIGKCDGQKLFLSSRKISQEEIKKRGSGQTRILRPDGLYAPVRKIVVEDYEGECIDLDVGGCHSYVANDVAVHNCWAKISVCSICANVATDPEEFCDHIRCHRGQKVCSADTKWEEKLAYEKNRGVVFFEDSIITDSEGADKNAKILNKLAAQFSPEVGFPPERLYKVLREMGKTASTEEKAMLTLLVEQLTQHILERVD